MSKKLLHTPEGVRDIYGEEYAKRMCIMQAIHDKFHLYGFKDIETPTFEYFDVFSKEIGTTSSKELYKFFDKEGNTLALRPDYTPSMARCVAKYFCEETLPVRFCYNGKTFSNTSNLQGKLKEVTQMGVELMGEDSIFADAEMISLLTECLKNTGLKNFQISIGNVEFFRGLCESAGLDQETEMQLRELISNKNYFAVESLLSEKHVGEQYQKALMQMSDLFGGAEILQIAETLAFNKASKEAVKRLKDLDVLLKQYHCDTYVSYDFGLLSKYNYYTGVIFKAYTYGVGDAIAKGGRYDTLLSQFGKASPAIGFAILLDDVVNAITRQHIHISLEDNSTCLIFRSEFYEKALSVANFLRVDGMPVELVQINADKSMLDYISYAQSRMHTVLISIENENNAKMYDVKTGEEKIVPIVNIAPSKA